MNIDNLILEITRRCNMKCEHCLKGDAENMNITENIIDTLLLDNNIEYISQVTFTGGEPSLNIKAIENFLKTCKNNNIDIGNYYIATNGKQENKEFLLLLLELYLYCSDNEITQVEVSRSNFHYDQDEHWIEMLKVLKFCSERKHLTYENIISEGRGKKLNEANGLDSARCTTDIETTLTIEDDTVHDTLFINAKGDILTDCDLSYETQEKLKIGNILIHKLIELKSTT